MKKVEVFLYSLYAFGIVLKLFKLPMHTVFILATLLILVVYYISCLIRKNKDRYSTLIGFVTVLWLFCLLAILKHFPFQNIVLIIAVLSTVSLLFTPGKPKNLISGNSLFCSIIILFAVIVRIMPAHSTYYLTNIRFNYEIETDYFSWDKYSWFLYRDGKEDEALQANQNAQTAVEKCLGTTETENDHKYAALIKEHQLAIRDKTWKAYP